MTITLKHRRTKQLAIIINLIAFLGASLFCSSFAQNNNEPWSGFEWTKLFSTETGQQLYLAKSSIYRLSHSPEKRSFYLKVLFPTLEEARNRPYNQEVSDMFMDCKWGQIDTLSVNRYLDDLKVDRVVFRQEQAQFIKPESDHAKLFSVICAEPEYAQALAEKEERKQVRGSNPWRQ